MNQNLEGHSIGPYSLSSQIGAGGMGVVYRRTTHA
jgi:hypothetical protein